MLNKVGLYERPAGFGYGWHNVIHWSWVRSARSCTRP